MHGDIHVHIVQSVTEQHNDDAFSSQAFLGFLSLSVSLGHRRSKIKNKIQIDDAIASARQRFLQSGAYLHIPFIQ